MPFTIARVTRGRNYRNFLSALTNLCVQPNYRPRANKSDVYVNIYIHTVF